MEVVEVKPFTYKFTCGICRSDQTANAEDVKHRNFGTQDDADYGMYVICPVCDAYHRIASRIVPPRVASAARTRGDR